MRTRIEGLNTEAREEALDREPSATVRAYRQVYGRDPHGWAAGLTYTDSVRIWLDLPDGAVRQLAEEGQDLSQVALEALAIDAYRTNRITAHQLCELLDIPSRYELDGFLKRHGVPLEYSLEDFEREGATSARLWEKRQAQPPAEPDDQRPA
jgi:predicted HTH domain antitoxin